MKALNSLVMSGREVLPVVEGGKGVSISTGASSGAWAAAGGIGTFSGVNADSYDAQGKVVPQIYQGKTRKERHEELIAFAFLFLMIHKSLMIQHLILIAQIKPVQLTGRALRRERHAAVIAHQAGSR